ncbi:MAG: sigma-54-dependent transcriptional regulator [Granulosicoccus sp.]
MATKNSAHNFHDILLVDDDPDTLKALQRVLEVEHYQTRSASSAKGALNSVRERLPAIVLLDLGLPDSVGVELLRTLLEEGVPYVIVVSGTDSAETTRQCLREGAFDFILKPAHRDDLLKAIRRATSSYQINQVKSYAYPVELKPGFGSLETPSQASRNMFGLLKKLAAGKQANALITGNAGLFKRDVAALLHHYTRRSGPALLINCALETDGNAVDRFMTHAGKAKDQTPGGYLERATDGTLILDDISLLPKSVQDALADYITRNMEIIRLDQNISPSRSCNVVGILKEAMRDALDSGRLQSSLYSVLAPNQIVVPALKDRPEDVIFFARHAVSQLNSLLNMEKSLSNDFLEFLSTQSWEGNLIELKNRLLTAYRGTEDGEEIVFDALLWPSATSDDANSSTYAPNINPLIGTTLADAEMQLIKATLASVNENKSKAAKILGISVKTLYNRLKK